MEYKFFKCENINIFGYLGPRGIILGSSWFTYTLSFILIYMPNMLSNLIRTIWVEIKKKIIIIIICGVIASNPGVPGVPKCQQMQTSSQWRHNVQQWKTFETSFWYMGQNVLFLAIWGALRGHSIIRLCLSCSPAIISPKFKSKIWRKKIIFGGSYVEPRITKLSGQ